jgi:hypothetical protein
MTDPGAVLQLWALDGTGQIGKISAGARFDFHCSFQGRRQVVKKSLCRVTETARGEALRSYDGIPARTAGDCHEGRASRHALTWGLQITETPDDEGRDSALCRLVDPLKKGRRTGLSPRPKARHWLRDRRGDNRAFDAATASNDAR